MSSVSFRQEDAIDIDAALKSDNHLKILLGFTALRDFIRQNEEKKTEVNELNPRLRRSKTFMLEEVIQGKGAAMLTALGRTPRPEVEYHSMGFDTYLELIQFAFSHSKLVEENTVSILIRNLNELLCQDMLQEDDESSDLEQLYWGKLIKIVEDDPNTGAEFLNKLNLWNTICLRANSQVRLNIRLTHCFSYIILHAACN